MSRSFIITCGAAKQNKVCFAYSLYTGSLFKQQLKWCKKNGADKKDVYILSAKYGLISCTKMIAPYNIKMGQKGCVTLQEVAEQAKAIEIQGEVHSSASGKYREIVEQIYPEAIFPFPKKTSMGFIMQALKHSQI